MTDELGEVMNSVFWSQKSPDENESKNRLTKTYDEKFLRFPVAKLKKFGFYNMVVLENLMNLLLLSQKNRLLPLMQRLYKYRVYHISIMNTYNFFVFYRF